MKKALLSGISGQDGSYLAELLLELGYEVHGIVRRVATENSTRLSRIEAIRDKVTFHLATLENFASIYSIFAKVQPDEIYHLGAQSFVADSFVDSFSTTAINCLGTQCMLESFKQLVPKARFYFAGSSEMFGQVRETPQTETTPFHPRSPYGVSKVFGFDLTRNYRESYGLHASSGILFNHEGPRRGLEFVTRKITDGIAKIVTGKEKTIKLGNLNAKRDWGFAGDYVKAMYLMLQQSKPDDYVIATGETHSIEEFCREAFNIVGLDWKKYVESSKKFLRPAEVDLLIGNASKAKKVLGWEPTVTFKQLVQQMVLADLKRHKG